MPDPQANRVDGSQGSVASRLHAATSAGVWRYEVGRAVARGGMGAILEARDLSIRRRVAMKVMLDPEGAPREQVLRFMAEAQVTGQLEHPGVVPVHELGQDPDGRAFYTMKFVQGATLKEILQRLAERDPATLNRYPLGALLTIFLKACDAVAFAHSRGVIHRDLKPENLMVGSFGEVLVMDWGLAKVLPAGGGVHLEVAPGHDPKRSAGPAVRDIDSVREDAEGAAVMTLDGDVMGTPAYMAPEQAQGKVGELDARADIYALGAVLYHILTLRPPVEGSTVHEVLERAASGHITPPSDLRHRSVAPTKPASVVKTPVQSLSDLQKRAAELRERERVESGSGASSQGVLSPFPHCPDGRIPAPLSAVVMRALARQPEDRYASVPELQADIEAWRGGFATAAEEAGLWRQLALLVRRHRVVASAATVTVLALGLGLGVSLVQWRRARLSERQAQAAQRQERETALAAAKRFAMQAIRAAETGHPDDAERRVQDVEAVSPTGPWAPYARGMLASLQRDYAAAAAHFRAALQADPGHTGSTAGLAEALSLQGDVEVALSLATAALDLTDWRALLKAGQTLYDNGRLRECQAPLERALALMGDEQDVTKGDALAAAEAVRRSLDTARAKVACEGFPEAIRGLPPEEQIRRVEAKLSEIHGEPISTYQPVVTNGEWVKASFEQVSSLRFLYPLAGLPLQVLHLSSTQVEDLTPLRGMPLKELWCGWTRVADLAPLRGMRLEGFACPGTQVSDFSPLQGMPLRTLYCDMVPVSDLSPLAGMPLTAVSLVNTPVRDLRLLGGLPLESLDMSGIEASDLSPLRGLRLTTLSCRGNPIADLAPLVGMPLASLDCSRSLVADLSPVAGMSLTMLHCYATSVADLGPLRGMPLEELRFCQTEVSDLTPLEGMDLKVIGLTPGRIKTGMEVMHRMQHLERVIVSWDPPVSYPAGEFWQRYDAGEFR